MHNVGNEKQDIIVSTKILAFFSAAVMGSFFFKGKVFSDFFFQTRSRKFLLRSEIQQTSAGLALFCSYGSSLPLSFHTESKCCLWGKTGTHFTIETISNGSTTVRDASVDRH